MSLTINRLTGHHYSHISEISGVAPGQLFIDQQGKLYLTGKWMGVATGTAVGGSAVYAMNLDTFELCYIHELPPVRPVSGTLNLNN